MCQPRATPRVCSARPAVPAGLARLCVRPAAPAHRRLHGACGRAYAGVEPHPGAECMRGAVGPLTNVAAADIAKRLEDTGTRNRHTVSLFSFFSSKSPSLESPQRGEGKLSVMSDPRLAGHEVGRSGVMVPYTAICGDPAFRGARWYRARFTSSPLACAAQHEVGCCCSARVA